MQEMGLKYTIVQYRADPMRQEMLNVGVILFDASTGQVEARAATGFSRLQKAFSGLNVTFVKFALDDFVQQVRDRFLSSGSFQAIEDFRRLRSNNLHITPLLPTFADSIVQEAERLFEELVGDQPVQKRRSSVASKMRSELKRLRVLDLFDRHPEPIRIPRYNFVLKPDLGLRREKLELIAASRFDNADVGLKNMGELAFAGKALAKTERMRLIVVGDFGAQSNDYYNAIKEDLSASNTELFRLEEMNALASRVPIH